MVFRSHRPLAGTELSSRIVLPHQASIIYRHWVILPSSRIFARSEAGCSSSPSFVVVSHVRFRVVTGNTFGVHVGKNVVWGGSVCRVDATTSDQDWSHS